MKYSRQIPRTDTELSHALKDAGWVQIKEPSNLVAAFSLSIPFLLINLLVVYVTIASVDADTATAITGAFASDRWEVTIGFDRIVYLYITVLLHEFLHLFLIPRFIRSDKTYFGIKPWGGFVFTAEPMSKCRFMVVSLGPFLFLSVIVPFLLGLSGHLTGFLVFLVLVNAMASSVDTLSAVLFFIQVPKGATVVNNGFESYYRLEGQI